MKKRSKCDQMVMMMIALVCCLISVSCGHSQDERSQPKFDTVKTNEYTRQEYYDRVPEAPLDLYWFINERISAEQRLQLCEHISTQLNGNLTADVGIQIENNNLMRVELVEALYFDEQCNARIDSVSVHSLSLILKEVDTELIPTLKDIEDSDFAVRVQFERFCPGYVNYTGLTTVDSFALKLRRENK